jgi:hypothetical protein
MDREAVKQIRESIMKEKIRKVSKKNGNDYS